MTERKVQAKGQTLPIIAFALVPILVMAGLILDGGVLWYSHWTGQSDLDAATCGRAAGITVQLDGASFVYGDGSVYGELIDTTPTFLLQLIGFKEFTYTVRSRCTRPAAHFTPVCVKSSWFDHGEHTILGQEQEADDQHDEAQGNDFAGACLPWAQSQVPDFDPRVWFSPATESQSPQPFKDLFRAAVFNQITVPLVPVGTRLPELSGVSNKFLVKAFVEAGLGVDDKIIVLEFDGVIVTPGPGYAPFENMEVIGYGLYSIDEIGTNYLIAHFDKRLDYDEVNAMTRVQQVPWDWQGDL